MPRARLSKPLPPADAVRQFTDTHIVQTRRRKNGEISQVKHGTFGWMSAKAYYALQKVHDVGEGMVRNLDPFKLAAFLALVQVNKSILDAGGSTIMQKLASKGQVDWLLVATAVLGGPFGFFGEVLQMDFVGIITGTTPAKPGDAAKWSEAVVAAFIELELGPVLFSVL